MKEGPIGLRSWAHDERRRGSHCAITEALPGQVSGLVCRLTISSPGHTAAGLWGAQLWMPGEQLLWAGVQSQPHYRPEKPLVLWDADWRCNHFPVCCMNFYFLVSHDLTLGRKWHNLSLPSAICRSFSPQNKLASCLRQSPTKLPWLACSSLCGLGWPWMHRDPSASASQLLEFRASHYHIWLVY